MSASTTTTSSTQFGRQAFWERFWRASGLQFVVFFVVIWIIYGYQPQLGASADELVSFYAGGRARILIAAFLSGLNILNLLWFTAALRTALADAGQDGWGAAATAASAAVATLFLLQISVGAILAYSIAGSPNLTVTTALNDFSWALLVLTSFPRAMLIMSVTFGLWRGALISNTLFAAGIAALILTLLGGSTWLGSIWAPDGVYSRFVSPIVFLLWIVVASKVILTKVPRGRNGW